ncbi:hypothetical protein BJF79_13845 [Actinomadura sp. CNU-125]|uniref:hypothetical protein n=1 Tax=Actinomadura sp. CNU-125 TaxID=1904961 RepID=UPI00095C9448|nr:hypothetical protein [Actinomadura sp. CNU-125]OLT24420.1 hypothetical protein BJF79_13845 [Actinomadura sp. CNU-125]
MADFEKLLAGAKLPETGVPICLRGDLAVEFERLETDLAEAREAEERDDSLAAGGQAREIAEQIEDLRQTMQDHTHTFRLRALPRKKWRDLLEEHPPREDNAADTQFGVNNATFPTVLIAASCLDPVMTEQQVDQLFEVLTEGQMLELYGAALALNRGSVNVPKSGLASAILARPAPKSKPPERGASRGGGSSAGSLAG